MKKTTNDPKRERQKRDAGVLGARALLFVIAASSAVAAVICFRSGFAPGRLAPRIGWFVGGSLLAVLSCLFWFFFSASLHTERHNLFLYDRDQRHRHRRDRPDRERHPGCPAGVPLCPDPAGRSDGVTVIPGLTRNL